MRQKLQNSKDYAESPEFLPALKLFFFFQEKVCHYNLRSYYFAHHGHFDPNVSQIANFMYYSTYANNAGSSFAIEKLNM